MKNIKKKEKYAYLMDKLKAAITNEYYYEAIFIEYAVLEDRTASILRHMKCNKNIDDLTLNDKLKCIENSLVVKNDKYIQRHLPKTMFSGLHDWKNARNKLVHDLVGLDYNNIQIKNMALLGNILVKKLNSKSTLVNNHLDKIM